MAKSTNCLNLLSAQAPGVLISQSINPVIAKAMKYEKIDFKAWPMIEKIGPSI